MLTSFVYYNNDTIRFLAVLLKKLNHNRKFIRVKQTDDIKHDWRETLYFQTVIITEFVSTNTILNERIS